MHGHHESLGDDDPAAPARLQQQGAFGGAHRHGLFAQHVLAGLGRLDRPGHVQVVGEGVIDHADARVGEQLFIRPVGEGDAEPFRPLARPPSIARGNGRDFGVLAPAHGGNYFLSGEL